MLHLHKFQQTPVECPEPSVRCRVLNAYIRAPINRIAVDWSPYKPGKHSLQEHRPSVTTRSFARKHCEFFFASSRFEALIFGCGEDMSLPEQLELTRHLATQLGSSFALPRGAKCSESQTYCESRLPFNSLQIVPRFLYVFFLMPEMLIDKSRVYLMKNSLRHTGSSVVRDFVNHV